MLVALTGCGYESPPDLPPRPDPYDADQREEYEAWVELRDERREAVDAAPLPVKVLGSVMLLYVLFWPITVPATVGLVALFALNRRGDER